MLLVTMAVVITTPYKERAIDKTLSRVTSGRADRDNHSVLDSELELPGGICSPSDSVVVSLPVG